MLGALQRPPHFPFNLTYLLFVAFLLSAAIEIGAQTVSQRVPKGTFFPISLVLLSLAIVPSAAAPLLAGLESSLWSQDFARWASYLALVGSLQLLNVHSLHRHRSFKVMAVVGLSVFVTVLAIFIFSRPSGLFGIPVTEEGSFRALERLVGFHDNPNGFATLQVVVLPLLIAFFALERSRAIKTILLLGLLVTIVTLLLTFSRSAWLGTVVGVAVIGPVVYYLDPKSFRALGRSLIIAGALVLGLLVADVQGLRHNTVDRMSYRIEEASTGRLQIWSHLARTMTEFPLGTGVGNLEQASLSTTSQNWGAAGRSPHNTFVAVAVETGPLGGAVFMLLVLASIFRYLRIGGAIERAAAASLIGFSIHALFHSVHQHPILWILIALTPPREGPRRGATTNRPGNRRTSTSALGRFR